MVLSGVNAAYLVLRTYNIRPPKKERDVIYALACVWTRLGRPGQAHCLHAVQTGIFGVRGCPDVSTLFHVNVLGCPVLRDIVLS